MMMSDDQRVGHEAAAHDAGWAADLITGVRAHFHAGERALIALKNQIAEARPLPATTACSSKKRCGWSRTS
jgi:hypothetical protein